MRVSREQARKNRSRILQTAGRIFRERGFEGAGLAQIMQAAGMTHGGFYNHFNSKADIAAEATRAAFTEVVTSARELPKGRDGLLRYIRRYLSADHVAHAGTGCPAPALSADAGRLSGPVTSAFGEGYRELLEPLMERFGQAGMDPAEARRRATLLLAKLVGAVVLARGMGAGAPASEILANVAADAAELVAAAN